MDKRISYVGLDVHKKFIQVAMLLPGQADAIEWRLPNERRKVAAMARRVSRLAPGEVQLCYEAGPCGYDLIRQLNAVEGLHCKVIAPSLIPKKPGERIKTDRRDAKKLAHYHQAGLLTEVHAPSPEDEARRELCRARGAAKADEKVAKQRVGQFLLRQGQVYKGGKSNWTQAHHKWLRGLRFEEPLLRLTWEQLLWALEHVQERLRSIDAALEEASKAEAVHEAVELLCCFKGIGTLNAMSLVTELHSFERFTSPRGLMAYLGMTPSEHSSGGEAHRGGITKAGNSRLRKMMVEATWNSIRSSRAGLPVLARRRDQPPWAVAIAEKAQQRLRRRYLRLTAKGKAQNKAVMAVAREFVGFIWAMLMQHTLDRLEAHA